MNKRKLLVSALIVTTLAGGTINVFAEKIKDGNVKNNKTITIIDNTKNVSADQLVASNIQTLDRVGGIDWLNENTIMYSKDNTDIKPISTDIGDFNIKTLYLKELNSQKEISIGDKSQNQEGAKFSPNKKHIFYKDDMQKDTAGYITDLDGNIKAKITGDSIHGYDLSEAQWINDEELIMPYHSIGGFGIIKLDGTVTKIEKVEEGTMGTENPLMDLECQTQ